MKHIMNHINAFKSNTALIEKFGEGNAHLIWTVSMYLDYPDKFQLGSESLTDGSNDKKIDFIRIDRDLNKIVFAQGYYATKKMRALLQTKLLILIQQLLGYFLVKQIKSLVH